METLNIIIKIVSTILIPVMVVWFGNRVSRAIKEKEIRVKYIEIAIDILKEKPDEKEQEIRQWAINVINEFSELKLPETVQQTLVKDKPLTRERWFETQKKYYDKHFTE